jgi:uncharacterized membrane protein YjgN (DUF898 family)
VENRLEFRGTGGALFVKLLVGLLLTLLSLGIYLPWFIVSLTKFLYENTSVKGTKKGELQLEFVGSGGQLFLLSLMGVILTTITLGIYGAWFTAKIVRYFADNSVAKALDGAEYRLQFIGTGSQIFVTVLVGYLLTMITFGIYGAWFAVKFTRLIAENTVVLENGLSIGSIEFVATGGQLFVILLVGYLLTLITFGIYSAWFAVKLIKLYSENTEFTINGTRYLGSFSGTGGEFFVLNLIGYLLSIVTLGIYSPWYFCRLWKFQINHTAFLVR